MPRISRHFRTETDALNTVSCHALRNETFAHGAGTAVAEPAIVFGGAAFIRKSGDNDVGRAPFHRIRNFLNLANFGRTNRLTVKIEINGRKLSALNVGSEKGGTFATFGQRRARDIVAGRTRRLAAALLSATGRAE